VERWGEAEKLAMKLARRAQLGRIFAARVNTRKEAEVRHDGDAKRNPGGSSRYTRPDQESARSRY
jgi:hypothetical protein